ncbi:PMT-domain-containing protein [Neoconidiobolus thromboides FSU 785]|nr:PMT-domain-containing protein [Neoconidiobolus thromboides FSU 785]
MSSSFSASEGQKNLRSRPVGGGQVNNDTKDLKSTSTISDRNKPTQEIKRSWTSYEMYSHYWLLLFIFLGFVTRFYDLSFPGEVVFDEVHFGKFASYYLRREFFFDVHPPLAKMVLALGGYFIGFDGSFLFEKIGLVYADYNVPYVGLRATSAIFGALNVPLVYMCMRESGYSILPSVVSTILVLFDGSLVTQSRLILLDSQLIFFATLSIYCYIRFYKFKYGEFTNGWWFWLIATGISLALTLGVKMVGLFVILTVGICVIVDLWKMLDIKRGYSMKYVGKHFAARAVGLIFVPIIVYLSIFWIHFKVLSNSGTGDAYMSPEFQSTLKGNEIHLNSFEIRYGDVITIKHKSTKNFLHSHTDRYPLRYKDGRVSSQGQQVTGYPHSDSNNHWRVLPKEDLDDGLEEQDFVKNGDIVRFEHVNTNSLLMTHDVASPTMPTNEEVTTVDIDIANNSTEKMKFTYFKISVDSEDEGQVWKSRSQYTKILHQETSVAIWSHPVKLPEWGYKHNEVNGNKNLQDDTNNWFVNEIIGKNDTEIQHKEPKHRNFFLKFIELHREMLVKNNQISASHPYATRPWQWPITHRGCSYWTRDTFGKKEQIYLLGNPFGYFLGSLVILLFVAYFISDQFLLRRGYTTSDLGFHNRIYNSGFFLLMAWGLHYFPFFPMGRQLFLHHYLPALIFKYCLVGAAIQYGFYSKVDPVVPDYPDNTHEVEVISKNTTVALKEGELAEEITLPTIPQFKQTKPVTTSTVAYIVSFVVIVLQIACFYYFAPITYGFGLKNGNEVIQRKWLSSWDLHYAKKEDTKADEKSTESNEEVNVEEDIIPEKEEESSIDEPTIQNTLE